MLVNKTLTALKQRLDSQGMLTVLAEQGSINTVTCSFNPPLESEKLRDYEKSSAWSFPEDFKSFLKLHNGARIFDMVLGDTNIGGGLELYSVDEIHKVYENLQLDSFYYPIGYVLESHLFISKEAIDQENPNYLYIAGTSLIMEPLNLNFELFLERFIISQGSNFWEWPFQTAENYSDMHDIDF